MKVFSPRKSAWMILLIPCSPLIALGVADLILHPSDWFVGLPLIALGVGVVCYNATLRLLVSEHDVTLTRFGRRVWSAPRRGSELRDGKGGDIPILPAYVIWSHGKRTGYILKSWFDADVIASLRNALTA
jgi:hypothetical protein